MSFFKKLFGQAPRPAPEPEMHEGYRIFPEPVDEPGGFRVAARIEKEIGGEIKTHRMIRADTYAAPEIARQASIDKARQLIDQQGERIFG
ncbi:HlyU family transcriptional regulator [Shimia sp.]|uniref:HlyU family transcriptional regulator n=1 Tax=Shimia sp. TaxID=1954381 RepID=UPI00356213B6